MASKVLIDQIQVPNPCPTSWDSMVGNDQIRFCEHCNLSVHNLSEMSRGEVLRLIARSNRRICVQYIRRPDGLIQTKTTHARLHQIDRRVSRLAAGALTATVGVSAAAGQPTRASTGGIENTLASVASLEHLGIANASLVGTVCDQNGARIPGATVSISNEKANLALYTSADASGEFRFDALEAGVYNLRIEAPGFSALQLDGIYLSEGQVQQLSETLKVAGVEASVDAEESEITERQVTGGMVAIAAPEDPLIRAAQLDDLETVAQLITGHDVNKRDKVSHTTALEHAVTNANREMVQLLISAGADINTRNGAGQTVLMMLGVDATTDLVWDLINFGAEVNARDSAGNTPLMEAASASNVDVLRTLLEAGADVNAVNETGKQTALMLAASVGYVNNVRTLVLAGASVNALDDDGKNALGYAMENDHKVTARFLKAQGIDEIVAVKREDEP